jgi:hypothetical protein
MGCKPAVLGICILWAQARLRSWLNVEEKDSVAVLYHNCNSSYIFALFYFTNKLKINPIQKH